MGSFTKWLSDLFGAARAEGIEANGYKVQGGTDAALELERIAIQSAVALIAAAVGQCRFRTFVKGEEVKGEEYYAWNYSPNQNQSSTQFIQELVETIIYNNEALVVEHQKQLFLADGYTYGTIGTRETVFSSISVNGEHVADRKARDALFLKMSNTDVRPLLSDVCRQYERIMEKSMDSYERACAEKGILSIDAAKRGAIDHEQYRKDLLDNRFKSFFGSKNAVLPLYSGYSYTPQTRTVRNTSEIGDVKTMSDEVYNRVGQAFRIPPAMLRGETAQSGDALDRFLRFAVRPICNMLEEEITRKRYGRKAVQEGSYLAIDTSGIEITGIFASADKLDKVIGCGILSIDEVREKVGEQAIGTEEARRHYVTKNYGAVDVGRKGEG